MLPNVQYNDTTYKEMEIVEISVSTQNNWWIARLVQGIYRLEPLLKHTFCGVPPFILSQHWKNSCRCVRDHVTLRGRKYTIEVSRLLYACNACYAWAYQALLVNFATHGASIV